MRSVVLLLLLAIAFGAAAMWQSRKVEALHAQRERAAAIRDGELADTPSGEVRAGWAVVTVGRPSGKSRPPPVEPVPEPETGMAGEFADELDANGVAPTDLDLPQPTPDDGAATQGQEKENWTQDYELIVEPGQSLSKIAAAHYGSGPAPLVEALARYNGMSDPDQLAAGQRLRLPPLDLLLRQ
jgi:nucleoid-associated protein YgaU